MMMTAPSTSNNNNIHRPPQPNLLKLNGTPSLIECGPNRLRSISVSWQQTTTATTDCHLAVALSDNTVRLYSMEGSGSGSGNTPSPSAAAAKEVTNLQGHEHPVRIVRCSVCSSTPHELLSADATGEVRLWDLRTHKSVYTLPPVLAVVSNNNTNNNNNNQGGGMMPVSSMEWNPVKPNMVALLDRSGTVRVYDTRKWLNAAAAVSTASAAATSATPESSSSSSCLSSLSFVDGVPESLAWDPISGEYLVVGCTLPNDMGALQACHYTSTENLVSYPAHAGPIYALQWSPDGQRLASGSADALVGLWDATSMCCTHTVTQRTKFIRAVSFSSDSRLLAIATEEDGIDVVDGVTGASVVAGAIQMGVRPRSGGAEAVAFCPQNGSSSNKYLLACARLSTQVVPTAPVTVVQFTVAAVGAIAG